MSFTNQFYTLAHKAPSRDDVGCDKNNDTTRRPRIVSVGQALEWVKHDVVEWLSPESICQGCQVVESCILARVAKCNMAGVTRHLHRVDCARYPRHYQARRGVSVMRASWA